MPRYRFALALPLVLALLAAEARAAGVLKPRDGGPPIGVRSHRVEAELTDGLARTTLRQTFVSRQRRTLEAVYVFPLPEDAALVDVAMEVDGKRLEGLLVERKRARKIYDDIVRSRRDPAIVEQIGRNLFRLSVFPVVPDVETVVELTWVQRVPLSQGAFRYVYPLSTGDAAARTKEDFTFVLRVSSSVPLVGIDSPIEDLDVVRKGPGEAVVSFERSGADLDRDIEVTARVEVEKPTLTVTTYRTGKDEPGWFAAVITPPKAKEENLVPRDVILVVDTSGSMEGTKIEQAKASALYLLDHLRAADRVNVLRFSSTTEACVEGPVPATPANLAALRDFVSGFEASGGTALGEALQTALAVPAAPGRARTVVLLTDGLPTIGEKDPAKIVGFAKDGAKRRLRVFCFGVGNDVNPTLLEGISRASGGQAEIFRPETEIESRLTAFLDRTASPVIAEIELTIYDLQVFDVLPRSIPDAYLGEQVVVAGRYKGGGEKQVLVTATVGGRPAKLTATAHFRTGPGGSRSVSTLFAREKLAFLQEALRLREGLADDAYYAAIDRGTYSTRDEIVAEMIEVSVAHSVQCPYTSFLVLLPEDRRRIDPRDAGAVAQALERAKEARGEPPPPPPADGGEEVARAPAKPSTKSGSSFFGGPRSSGGSFGGGGAYRGPGGEVPPGSRDPSDPQPPPESPGVPTPPAAGPAGPAPAGGAAGGPGAAAAAPPGGRLSRPSLVTFDHWLFWWAYNRDEILELRSLAGDRLDAARHAEVVAGLEKAVANPGLHPAIRSSALIALARCDRTAARADTIRALAAPKSELRGAAVVSLGVLQIRSAEIRDALIAILDDPTLGPRIRAHAAVSLGLLHDGSPESVAALRRRLTGGETRPDVPVCALLALGLIGDEALVPEMVSWLEAGKIGAAKLDDLTRAHLVSALGRIGDPRALEPVAKAFRGKGLHSRRSAAIALGQLVPALDPEGQRRWVATIAKLTRMERDVATANFLRISLGRIGAADGVDPEARKACEAALVRAIREGNKGTERPFAALGAGLMGPASASLQNRLRDALASRRGDKPALGALAIALARMGDARPETVEVLAGIARDRGEEKRLRGACFQALGLLGVEDDLIRESIAEREDRDLRTDTSLAAGALGDRKAVDAILAVFRDPKASQFVLFAAARALGRIGDASVVKPLLEVLEPGAVNGAFPDLTRNAAALALGRLAANRPDPLWQLTKDLNYRASVPALEALTSVP